MSFSWLSNLLRSDPRLAPRRLGGRPAHRRLEVEPLEPRWLLAVNNPVIDGVLVNQDIDEGQGVDFEVSLRDADLLDTYTATIDWGDGPVEGAVVNVDPRDTSSLTVTIDYRFDDNDFFDTQAKKDILQIAADAVASHFGDTLSAIMPGLVDNMLALQPTNPATGESISIISHEELPDQIDLTTDGDPFFDPEITKIAENEVIVFVGSRALEDSNLAFGGFGGFQLFGSPTFRETVQGRGQSGAVGDDTVTKTDFGPWGGSIAFSADENVNWHFGLTTGGLDPGETDFLSVAVHEFAHLFGFGTAPSWDRLVDTTNNVFEGLASTFEFDDVAVVPLEPDDTGHWEEGTLEGGVETAMDPKLSPGARKMLTALDFAGLTDVGWDLLGETTGTIAGSHVYADDGTYTVTIHLTEIDGSGSTVQTFEVTVQNVLPEITVVDDQIVSPGEELTIINLVTITDPGFDNPSASQPTTEDFFVLVDWGDNTQLTSLGATTDRVGSPGVSTLASVDSSHTYSEEGEYSATVTVVNDGQPADDVFFAVRVVFPADAMSVDPDPTTEDEILILEAPGIIADDIGFGLQVTQVRELPSSGGDPVALPFDVPVQLESGAIITVHRDGSLEFDPTISEVFNQLENDALKSDFFDYDIVDSRGNTDTAVLELQVVGRDDGVVMAEFNTSLVRSPSPTDSFGQVEVLPSSRPWLHEWSDFWLEVWVQIPLQKVTNIESALADVVYNSDYFTATSVVAGPAFAGGFSSAIDDTTGTVHLDGDRTSLKRIGADEHVLLARVRFRATDDDPGVPILFDEPAPVAPIDEVWIALGNLDVTLLAGTGLDGVDAGPAPTTDLYPLLYDLDDDGSISFGDLANFALFFLADVGATPEAAKADFDASGKVDFGDFGLFAANFLKNSSSDGSVGFPNNFPEDFGPQMLVVDAAGSPQGAALLTDDQLGAIARDAAARLGASPDEITFEVVDLREGVLGQASGSTIQIDVDAAGYGWYIDTTPSDDVEFSMQISATEFAAAADHDARARVDLLTVVMHELGHVLDDVFSSGHTTAGELMDGSLPLGTRRLSDGDDSDGDDDHALEGELVDDFFAALDN